LSLAFENFGEIDDSWCSGSEDNRCLVHVAWGIVATFEGVVTMKKRNGFTLVELVVVVAITALMFGLLAQAVLAVVETSRCNQCIDNLRSIGVALQTYHEVNACYPPADLRIPEKGVDRVWSWTGLLIPYFGEAEKYADYWNLGLVSPSKNLSELREMQSRFMCPSDGSSFINNERGGLPKGNYVGISDTKPDDRCQNTFFRRDGVPNNSDDLDDAVGLIIMLISERASQNVRFKSKSQPMAATSFVRRKYNPHYNPYHKYVMCKDAMRISDNMSLIGESFGVDESSPVSVGSAHSRGANCLEPDWGVRLVPHWSETGHMALWSKYSE
jgi:prepilin-type N-terminal cleavage/methylation domain-containing protein